MAWSLVVHGGVADYSDWSPQEVQALNTATSIGSYILKNGGLAVDAVEMTIRSMEDSGEFNAGLSGEKTRDGQIELEASLMDGYTLNYGAVIRTQYPNPIAYARMMMERKEPPYTIVDPAFPPPINLRIPFTQNPKRNLFGTVGCCARDMKGHLCAGTSTGGLHDKLPGRVGDSSIIGAGTYADDNVAAISCSGAGEELVRYVGAHSVYSRMSLLGLDIKTALYQVLHDVMPPSSGGMIGIDAQGQIVVDYNTKGFLVQTAQG